MPDTPPPPLSTEILDRKLEPSLEPRQDVIVFVNLRFLLSTQLQKKSIVWRPFSKICSFDDRNTLYVWTEAVSGEKLVKVIPKIKKKKHKDFISIIVFLN